MVLQSCSLNTRKLSEQYNTMEHIYISSPVNGIDQVQFLKKNEYDFPLKELLTQHYDSSWFISL